MSLHRILIFFVGVVVALALGAAVSVHHRGGPLHVAAGHGLSAAFVPAQLNGFGGPVPTACLTGEYPVPLPDESMLGKHLLEVSLTSPTAGKALPVLNNP